STTLSAASDGEHQSDAAFIVRMFLYGAMPLLATEDCVSLRNPQKNPRRSAGFLSNTTRVESNA
ncbi:hypothetical protein, partial [Pseudomonas viridiflava]|uniref:hypothetical protein n=1 Tax=Pseudomonas viridiflava TaxID=33069 RepID=UPI001981EFF6